ncbi:MAG: enoyl-CoA hydratase/isomerase family protein [Planctomycetes bacterium]|nr:enoyl-CoA hydratase/isomerase family protein [Planctomycetota bacterium]
MPIEVNVSDRIAHVALNAPPLNILTSALQSELRAALEALRERDDHNAVFLTSALDGKFSAGADVGEHIGRDNCKRMLEAAHGLIAELLRTPVPTLCFVDGPCLGGAFELALACDQIVASERSTFGTPEIQLGCYPPAAMVLMPQKLPAALAAELIQGGHGLTSVEFAQRGAGIRVVDELSKALEMAGNNYRNLPRGALVEATRLLRSGSPERFAAQVGGIEQAYLERLTDLQDAIEGAEAFLAKRKPVWDHRSVGGR